MLIFAGRNPFAMLDARPQQELDHVRLVRSITKWAQVVHDPARLGEYVDMAARIALSGDPGPVLLEIPRDVAVATVDEAAAAAWLGPVIRAHAPASGRRRRGARRRAVGQRETAVAGVRPGRVLVACGDAVVRRLNREFGLPVLLAGSSRGLIPEDFETVFPWPIGSIAARDADVVILAGARMEGAIGFAAPPFFSADAAFIQIASDAAEIGRNRVVAAPMAARRGWRSRRLRTRWWSGTLRRAITRG